MSTDDTLLIAVDGGGTGCRVAVGTPAAGVLAEAAGGAANIKTSFDGSMANIIAAAEEALQKADLQSAKLQNAVAHVGLAGADTADSRARASAALPYGHCTVTGDRETSVAGVLGHADGYVIALGTGTIIARQQAGVMRTVNGWGFDISDHASGAWLGHQLVTRALLMMDGMERDSALGHTVAENLGGVQGMVDFSLTAVPGDYARFAPEVVASAKTGDALARDLMTLGARFLERGLDALGFGEGDLLSLSGGLGPHYLPYLSAAYTQCIEPPKGSALDGAFTLAKDAALTM